MPQTEKTQVLIIGGGPAGVISAITAGKSGKDVILIDSKPYPEIGTKICGDGLIKSSTDFLQKKIHLQPPSGSEIASIFQIMIFRVAGIDFPLTGNGYMLNRSIYGQRLLKEAEKNGTIVRSETKSIQAIIKNKSIVGALVQEKNGKKYNIRAKITIDCSGRSFQIRKNLPSEIFPFLEKKMAKRDIAASYREIIKLKGHHSFQDRIMLEFRKNIPEGGYFWIFGKGPQRLNVGIGWRLGLKAEGGMKNLFQDILHEYFPPDSYVVEKNGGYTIPMRYPLLNAVASGFLTAGDAAFHANPLSAEGHGSALIAGYYAGKSASNAININDLSQNQLWEYNRNITKHFGLTHTKYQLFSEALRKIKIQGLEFLLKRAVLKDKDFIDLLAEKRLSLLSKFRIITKAFPRYNMLYNLSKIQRDLDFFEKLFANYPYTPDRFPAWIHSFNTRMNQIRKG